MCVFYFPTKVCQKPRRVWRKVVPSQPATTRARSEEKEPAIPPGGHDQHANEPAGVARHPARDGRAGLEVLRHLRAAQAALSAAAGVQSTKRGNAAMRAAALDAVWKLRNRIDLIAAKVVDDVGREAWARERPSSRTRVTATAVAECARSDACAAAHNGITARLADLDKRLNLTEQATAAFGGPVEFDRRMTAHYNLTLGADRTARRRRRDAAGGLARRERAPGGGAGRDCRGRWRLASPSATSPQSSRRLSARPRHRRLYRRRDHPDGAQCHEAPPGLH